MTFLLLSDHIRSVVSDSLQSHESQHARSPCPSPTPGVHSNSRPSSRWYHPAISSSAIPFSCPQSLPASESFPMSQLFAWGSQNTGVSALASVLPKNTQGWSPLEWTGWISLQSKGLSRVFSNTTVQKQQFFSAQLSSHWPLVDSNLLLWRTRLQWIPLYMSFHTRVGYYIKNSRNKVITLKTCSLYILIVAKLPFKVEDTI